MFAIVDQACVLEHVNVRIEKHGDEEQVAADLKLSTTIQAAWLGMFHEELREALYKPESERKGADLVSQAQPDERTFLRFTNVEPLKLTDEMKGRVTLAMPVSGDKVVLPESKLNKFTLYPKDGGSVEVTFRVQSPIEPEDASMITAMLTREVRAEVEPLRHEPDLVDTAGDSDGGEED